jgi:hypothetical protein
VVALGIAIDRDRHRARAAHGQRLLAVELLSTPQPST